MDASTAVDECENRLSLQGSSSQDAALISSILGDKHEQDDDQILAFIPDPTVIMEPSPDYQNSSTGPPKSGSGRAWGSDKCVVMRCYRPGSGRISEYQVVTSEVPVLISRLRFAEQNVAYETLLAKAPASEMQEQYRLHLTHLKPIREAIAARVAVIYRLRGYHLGHDQYPKGARDNARSQTERQILEKRIWVFKKAIKERDKLRACERAVMRLLVRCEDAGKGEPGFKKVDWQTGQ